MLSRIGILHRKLILNSKDLFGKIDGKIRQLANHRYEVHPIGGETEVIMDIHTVIVHNN